MRLLRLFLFVLALMAAPLLAQEADHAHHHGSQSPAGNGSGDLESSSSQMAERNLSESNHMKMTPMAAPQPGDQEQAAAVLAGARKAMEQYRDVKAAIADGYQIFLPKLPQKMYHFTNYQYAMEATFTFNPEHPTSLLYEKHGNDYKLIGVMYTAPAHATPEQLNERVPLSVAQWHAHVNFCQAPKGREKEYFGEHPQFGLLGSITTREQCEAHGGRFIPQVFGWMVHAYPDEKTAAQVWSMDRQMEHGHGHMH
jgi:hypothetical protein